jgi:arginine N-succinyltransferase
MLIIRPVTESDHSELLAVAREAGIGMTSLPADADVLEAKIKRAVGSFAQDAQWLGNEAFLFVLEDTDTGAIAGTAGIVAHVGIKHPFYSYKLSTLVQESSELGIYGKQRVLHLVNDYTGASELGSLFLRDGYRRDGIGRFLSRCRYMMIAQFPQLFSDVVISEIRGVQDENGSSPFYRNLAKHFFQMPFAKADFINATQGGQFISDLMPKYPIYVNLLAEEAQAVIGKPLQASLPAMQMLESEGFSYQGYVDVFDAGPTVQAERERIRTVRKSKQAVLCAIKTVSDTPRMMVCNSVLSNFRATFCGIEETTDGVALSAEAAKQLGLGVGDTLRYIEA